MCVQVSAFIQAGLLRWSARARQGNATTKLWEGVVAGVHSTARRAAREHNALSDSVMLWVKIQGSWTFAFDVLLTYKHAEVKPVIWGYSCGCPYTSAKTFFKRTLDLPAPALRLLCSHITRGHIDPAMPRIIAPLQEYLASPHMVVDVVEVCHDRRGQRRADLDALVEHLNGTFGARLTFVAAGY